MPTPVIAGNFVYPSMLDVLNLVRSMVQDDMAGATGEVGEGQVFVDNTDVSVTMMNFFNSALRELCRRLRLTSYPGLIRDMYILLGLPPINGSLGVGVPDPMRQQNLGFTGFFDGLVYWSDYTLPNDCIMVDELWERTAGTDNVFTPMTQPARALNNQYQLLKNGQWEWRTDGVWFCGTTQSIDLRIRYQSRFNNQFEPGVDLATLYVPIIDCEEAMALLIAKRIAIRQGAPMLQVIAADCEAAINHLSAETTKRAQGIDYNPQSFGSEVMGLQ